MLTTPADAIVLPSVATEVAEPGMMTVETIGRIRREHFIKGNGIRRIAGDLKVSRQTVRRAIAAGAERRYRRETHQRLPQLGAFVARLEELLTANAERSRRDRGQDRSRRTGQKMPRPRWPRRRTGMILGLAEEIGVVSKEPSSPSLAPTPRVVPDSRSTYATVAPGQASIPSVSAVSGSPV